MFKVGQKVWCAIYGAGVVAEVDGESAVGNYCIDVKFKDGLSISYTNDGKYHKGGNVTLFPYPIEIVKAITKPSIDWSHVNSRYNYLAQDDTGTCWVYEHVPILIEDEWASSRGDCTPADCLQSLVPGTCSWIDSLVERPTGNSGDN